MSEKKRESTSVYYLKLIIGLFLMFGFGHICPTWGGITQVGVMALGIFIGVVFLIVTGYGLVMPSLVGMFALLLTGFYSSNAMIAATTGSATVFQLILVYALCQAVVECGAGEVMAKGFRLSCVKLDRYYEAMAAWKKSPEYDATDLKRSSYIVYLEHKAVENGGLHDILSPGSLVYPMPGDRTCTDVTLDATHTLDCHCDDIVDLSRQVVDQHRKVIWFTRFLNQYVPGFEKAVLTSFAPMNGIRAATSTIRSRWSPPCAARLRTRTTACCCPC